LRRSAKAKVKQAGEVRLLEAVSVGGEGLDLVGTGVAKTRIRKKVEPAWPLQRDVPSWATFTPIFALSVVLAIAATPIVSRKERRIMPSRSSGRSLSVRPAAKVASG